MSHFLLLLVLAAGQGQETTSANKAAAYQHFSLGLQSRLAGDFELALTEFRRAQKLDPMAAEPHVEAAKLLRDTGRIKEAMPEAEEGVRLGPQSADAHLILGQLHQSQIEERGEAAVRAAA